jgi:hypothetical protein
MALNIKWNDDRVRGTATALLLISRNRLVRGESAEDLIAEALAEYRADPAAYKLAKADWPDVRDTSPLKKAAHIARYQALLPAVDALLAKIERNKRQSNSLTELDNYFLACLKDVGVPVKKS